MKQLILILSSIFIISLQGISQVKQSQKQDQTILFRGIVMDATSLAPISNSQIMINSLFSSLSREDGSFSFYVNLNDTVLFRSLGYKPAVMHISDTLRGSEFITGVYLSTDTVAIGEVVIIPGYSNLKSEILNSKTEISPDMENARYNVAISAYQGKTSSPTLGNPIDNYNVISQRQKIYAFEKGGIPSEHIVGFNPLIFLPAAYILLHGLPEPAPPMKPGLTDEEVKKIHRKYLETAGKKSRGNQ
jgi:hypothetical protein